MDDALLYTVYIRVLTVCTCAAFFPSPRTKSVRAWAVKYPLINIYKGRGEPSKNLSKLLGISCLPDRDDSPKLPPELPDCFFHTKIWRFVFFTTLMVLVWFWLFWWIFLVNLVSFGLFLKSGVFDYFFRPKNEDVFKNAKFGNWFPRVRRNPATLVTALAMCVELFTTSSRIVPLVCRLDRVSFASQSVWPTGIMGCLFFQKQNLRTIKTIQFLIQNAFLKRFSEASK